MERLLIIGCGDIAQRLIPLLRWRYQLYALVRNPAHLEKLRALAVKPVPGDLDDRSSLYRLAGLPQVVLHLAPPANAGVFDIRTRHLLSALSRGRPPRRFIYISTSGVYGDCGGELVSETHRLAPRSERAQRRVDAEMQIRNWSKRNGVGASILRVPGIYANDRLPLDRLRSCMPVFREQEDSYSNHIHADDLARIVLAALRNGKANRTYNASDDGQMKMGDYFDAVADAFGVTRPPRLERIEAQRVLPASLLSFMNESRRLENQRLKRELKVQLVYSTVTDFLKTIR